MSDSIRYKSYEIEIKQEDDPPDPREWDNTGIMCCFHFRYDLGDKHDIKSEDFQSWDEIQGYLEKEENAICVIPLRLYDHGGITISASNNYPYNCRWDSMYVGFIYTTLKQLKYIGHDWKRITKGRLKRIRKWLLDEIETYDQYIRGDVYCCSIEENGDCCCGYYGCDHEKNGLLDYVRDSIDHYIESERKRILKERQQHYNKLKKIIQQHIPLIYRKPLVVA